MKIGAMETILATKAPDSLNEATEAGFDGLELDIAGPDPADDPVWTPSGRTRIRRRASELNVELPSLCLGFLNKGGLTADDPDTRADARSALYRSLDAAAALGIDVVLVPFFGTGQIETERDRDRVVDGTKRVTDAAEAAGVTLALETTLSGADDRELLERIDSPAVGSYYDTGNAFTYGHDPVAGIRELGDHIVRVHFKDYDSVQRRCIGDGEVDSEGCVAALREIGYDDWIVLETPAPDDPFEDATSNLQRVRELLD